MLWQERKISVLIAIFGALWLGAHALLAQVANPASEAARPVEPAEEAQPASEPPGHLPSWRVPGETVTVVGKAPLREEDLIGPYRQPRWTARRRFGETRVYVVPEGDVQFEYWLVPKLKRDGEETEIEQQLSRSRSACRGGSSWTSTRSPTRRATPARSRSTRRSWRCAGPSRIGAGSGEIPRSISNGRRSATSPITPRRSSFWATNLVFEHEMGGEKTNARELTAGLSRTLRDEKLSLGAEAKLAWEDVEGDRGNYAREYLVGPSFQVHPLPQAHLDVVLLAGLNDDAPRAKGIFIFGWEL